jgi:hypothetical protein
MKFFNFNQQIVLDIDELSRTDIDEPIVLIKDYRDISGEDVIQVFIFTVQSKRTTYIRDRFHQTFFTKQKVVGKRRSAKNLPIDFTKKKRLKIGQNLPNRCAVCLTLCSIRQKKHQFFEQKSRAMMKSTP